MVDSVYRTRSLGVAAEGLPDQYADGKAARVWQLYIGDTRSRTDEYRNWLRALLKEHGCQQVLDVACGTGVDSIMMLEEGFSVVSVDASDKMLKYALKERWDRRKEEAFDKWVIEEANWLTLMRDVPKPKDGFDAVICLGNSFAHLPDFKGDQSDQKLALANIAGMVKPGGILIIDHRNYDYILQTGRAPPGKNIYYKSDLTKDITTSVLWVNGNPHMITLDYTVQVPVGEVEEQQPEMSKFRLSYYPHRLDAFTELLKSTFKGKCEHRVFGDFKPYKRNQEYVPCYFIHVLQKIA
ncbi:glycine N-methyltransferase [Latimeria chalumnae]|uniref:Glycine N-methyltransferase n=1 Tax=Latimeria chalumnae TaxID=7897 RepID=H3AJK9_LATCH|nr:PREDICTED: glycine N-methyltransferase [Latimeria chalumnae]|eukprot:XP_005996721.1 PREDICTED: glycine N-methyltransferase [Latimeria chalumnae]